MEKTIPNYTDLPANIADLLVTSISINSGYTSILKEEPGNNLMQQVTDIAGQVTDIAGQVTDIAGPVTDIAIGSK